MRVVDRWRAGSPERGEAKRGVTALRAIDSVAEEGGAAYECKSRGECRCFLAYGGGKL